MEQADQMPMSCQGDTAMKRSDIFQGAFEQSISRRDEGVSVSLYTVLVKPELGWWATFRSSVLNQDEFTLKELHQQDTAMFREQKVSLWHSSHQHLCYMGLREDTCTSFTNPAIFLTMQRGPGKKPCISAQQDEDFSLEINLRLNSRVTAGQLKSMDKAVREYI